MKKFVVVNFVLMFMFFASKNNFSHEGEGGPPYEVYLQGSVYASSCLEDEREDQRYAAWRVFDCDNKTSWVEGADDEGIGEKLTFKSYLEFANVRGIEILPGVTTNERLFKLNNRPKIILVEYIGSGSDSMGAEEYVVFSKEIVLKDEKKFQRFMFDNIMTKYINDYDLKHNTKTQFGGFIIVIKDVYKGSKYNDTGIAEIKFLDKSGVVIDPLKEFK